MTKFKLIIFDLDGVLIDSKKNMSLAWSEVKKKHSLKNDFKEYFKFIGYPFGSILKKLGIKKNHTGIQATYSNASIIALNKIRLFKNIKEVLKKLKNNKIKMAILTSKDKNRTRTIVKKFDLPFSIIQCGEKGVKGKPYPFQINKIIKKFKFQRNEIAYVGDMKVDFLLTKKAKINFIFANYGYGKDLNYKYKIETPKDLLKFLHN